MNQLSACCWMKSLNRTFRNFEIKKRSKKTVPNWMTNRSEMCRINQPGYNIIANSFIKERNLMQFERMRKRAEKHEIWLFFMNILHVIEFYTDTVKRAKSSNLHIRASLDIGMVLNIFILLCLCVTVILKGNMDFKNIAKDLDVVWGRLFLCISLFIYLLKKI